MESFDKEFGKLNISDIDPDKLHSFLDDNFHEPTSELIDCIPDDWYAYFFMNSPITLYNTEF